MTRSPDTDFPDRKTVLIVHAQPEPTSLTRTLVDVAEQTLRAAGHEVLQSDLYAMGWKAVYDEQDFPVRTDSGRLDFVRESGHAFEQGHQPADVVEEQRKLLVADLVILQFPLWWFGMPAIMKGWIDRVWARGLAYGRNGQGNRMRYGEGGFEGRRAMVSVTTGGPSADYGPRGINGPIDQLLFPITHGTLFYPGMSVLKTQAVHGAGRMTPETVEAAAAAWRERLAHVFDEAPVAFRAQNGGDYPDGHELGEDVAPGLTGFAAHVAA
ncbi:NAD(P)H-dependent oxidoreductase [Mitsuaria sp. 7]|uniref:NAD(P)H-dependent oxidoreductase n=1 Tax=Mitsuaria sp. 7 TaxID=1658665 RepID=UPI0007DDED43|nr:NAD(P)H-dependent oxidoreductase [Mitsuaria sp. 7]ANH71017.1 NAD(P)H dehydrogenase [Mitsuaria sp. 7]